MSDAAGPAFVETREYRRFREFCDACRRDRYIGLCCGPPGVGKTLSARHYADWDRVEAADLYGPHDDAGWSGGVPGRGSVFYTAKVVNSPRQIEGDIGLLRTHLRDLISEGIRREEGPRIAAARRELEREQAEFLAEGYWYAAAAARLLRSEAALSGAVIELARRRSGVGDPTELILVDEADRIKMTGLEQLRDIFDRGGVGLVLIGMPGLERRLARYAQLSSRVGFVHEYRPLGPAEVRGLLSAWRPPGVVLPEDLLVDKEGVAALIRVSGGNFRLLDRLLAQVGRILEINGLATVTREAVEAAREVLVIGAA